MPPLYKSLTDISLGAFVTYSSSIKYFLSIMVNFLFSLKNKNLFLRDYSSFLIKVSTKL